MNYSLKMSSLKERAHNKAFAKLTMLEFEIADLASDLKAGRTGGITYDELSSILVGTKVERWATTTATTTDGGRGSSQI